MSIWACSHLLLLSFLVGGQSCSSCLDCSSKEEPSLWGDLEIRVLVEGEIATPTPLEVTKDREVLPKRVPDESIVLDPDSGSLANVVVYLLPPKGEPLPVHPGYKETASQPVTLEMKNGRFEPHVLLLQTGQPMRQKNWDRAIHHARIDFLFNLPK